MKKNKNISIRKLIEAAIASCSAFTSCSYNFFKNRDGWRGWENWLTVDITRQINSDKIIPFAQYSEFKPNINSKMDILVTEPKPIAIEVKVSYWTNKEFEGKKKILLPDNVVCDIRKLKKAGQNVRKVLFFSILFESADGLEKYYNLFNREQRLLKNMNWKFYDCSVSGGHNILLVISDVLRLPNIKRK